MEASIPEVSDISLPFLNSGKRTRANLARLGYEAVSAHQEPTEHLAVTDSPTFPAALIELGCAIELFQASALVHDDIIDRSDLRRGRPTVHKSFAQLCAPKDEAEHFGFSAAILLGDFLLSLAEESVKQAALLAQEEHPEFPVADFLADWSQMTKEVALGQYMDLRLERKQPSELQRRQETEREILNMLRHKSAHYSVAYPLLLGSYLGQARPDETQRQALFEMGDAWGLAFQLADDDLGVFGAADVTGKAAGLDLIDGKRTLLWAETYFDLVEEAAGRRPPVDGLKRVAHETKSPTVQSSEDGHSPHDSIADLDLFTRVFGNQSATKADVAALTAVMDARGIRARHRQIIADYCQRGNELLDSAPLPAAGKALLAELGQALSRREK